MKKTVSIAVFVATASIVAIGWKLASNKKEIESRKEIKTENTAIAVRLVPASLRSVENSLEAVGVTEARREVTIASESAGKITQIHFKWGDFVKQGKVLAQVDDGYKKLAFENAGLMHDKYKEDYERFQVLQQGDAVSEAQLREMRIACENASIQLRQAGKQLNDTRIIAPFDGYIISRTVELGAFVNPGTPVAGIADISTLKVVLSVSESDAYRLKAGQKAEVSASVYPGIRFSGTVSNIGAQGDKKHTYPIEITLVNKPEYPLKSGTYVNVRVDLGGRDSLLMIPRDAIAGSVKEASVYRVENEVARLVKINTGREDHSFIEVLSGLKEGDLVVTSGQINLADEAKVSIIP
jgi:RND family efflux transporter MFP subunit